MFFFIISDTHDHIFAGPHIALLQLLLLWSSQPRQQRAWGRKIRRRLLSPAVEPATLQWAVSVFGGDLRGVNDFPEEKTLSRAG